MEKFLTSNVSHSVVPESYIYPPEQQPGKSIIPIGDSIPVIDLGGGREGDDHASQRSSLVEQIMKASEEFGFFQVINHGIPEELLQDAMEVASEFFEMPIEDRIQHYSNDPNRIVRVLKSSLNERAINNWREALRISGYPMEKFAHLLPEKPSKFRDVVGRYSTEVTELGKWILKMINEGLGLEEGYFDGELSGGEQFMLINHYPPCPDPSMTLGLVKHCDQNLITILLQGKTKGLQVIKDGKWIVVEPIPNALIVNMGHQLEVISNGRLKSVQHRAVTNSSVARTTVVNFIVPTLDCLISPAPALVGQIEDPIYRPFTWREYLSVFREKDGDPDLVLDAFKFK